MSQKQITILLLTLAAAAVFLFLAVFIGLDLIPAETPAPGEQGTGTPPAAISPSANDSKIKILDAAPRDPRAVIYTQTGFSIREITIQITDSVGCLVTIENKTAAPLRVGVGPHNPDRDPGADYGEIAPGESEILDPRYTGLPGVSLHNHAKPEHEFFVAYGNGCR